LEQVAAEEQLLLQRQRDLEEQAIREAIVGKRNEEPGQPLARTEQEEDELDLATIPRYEEYR
jgi:hypothetical protein